MSKSYKIESIRDIIDCTNEDNLDNFLVDLKNVIKSSWREEKKGYILKEFIWIDDGKFDGKVEIVGGGRNG